MSCDSGGHLWARRLSRGTIHPLKSLAITDCGLFLSRDILTTVISASKFWVEKARKALPRRVVRVENWQRATTAAWPRNHNDCQRIRRFAIDLRVLRSPSTSASFLARVQRLICRSRPTALLGRLRLLIDEMYWPAIGRPKRAAAIVVNGDARIDVACVADVETVLGAAEDVDEEGTG